MVCPFVCPSTHLHVCLAAYSFFSVPSCPPPDSVVNLPTFTYLPIYLVFSLSLLHGRSYFLSSLSPTFPPSPSTSLPLSRRYFLQPKQKFFYINKDAYHPHPPSNPKVKSREVPSYTRVGRPRCVQLSPYWTPRHRVQNPSEPRYCTQTLNTPNKNIRHTKRNSALCDAVIGTNFLSPTSPFVFFLFFFLLLRFVRYDVTRYQEKRRIWPTGEIAHLMTSLPCI